jgi:hypothetical protein
MPDTSAPPAGAPAPGLDGAPLRIGELRHLAEDDHAGLLFLGGRYRSVGPAL